MKTKDLHEKVELLMQFFISGGQHKLKNSYKLSKSSKYPHFFQWYCFSQSWYLWIIREIESMCADRNFSTEQEATGLDPMLCIFSTSSMPVMQIAT